MRLHLYYQTLETTADNQLLAIRADRSHAQPSLPQTAGRAFARITRSFQIASDYGQGDYLHFRATLFALARLNKATSSPSGLAVTGVVDPRIDVVRLARAFLLLVEQEFSAIGEEADHAA